MAHPASTPASYVSPLPSNSSFTFVPGTTIYNNVSVVDTDGIINDSYYKIRITRPNGEVAFEQGMETGSSGVHPDDAQGYTEQSLMSGIYVAYYVFTYPYTIPIAGGSWTIGYKTNTATYTFTVVDNKLPLKRWTATDVINRLLDLAEPLREQDYPRFRLQGINRDRTMEAGSQAALFDTILSPEFAFTKQTLRECLQQVGEIIHGEPRITPKKDKYGWYYEVSYDLYGQAEQWKHANRPHVKKSVTQNVNTYSTNIDTHTENLIKKTSDGNGTITEPYSGGAQTVRTEQMYVQITETNMIIPTLFPIYSVESVKWITDENGTLKEYEIKDYLFESSVYGTQLSSYDVAYPYSKAYGIMYTQGQKNITQLSFKPENPIDPIFENYAILNILRAVTGNDSLKVDYSQLAFRVVYTPIYQSRVGQAKLDFAEYRYKAAMIYNQQANIVDSRAYGENLKGVIARLGNAEKSFTYRLSRLSQIPKAGMMFDEDYTISAVYTEILPTVINCTIGLTKNFNRISQYVGISSVKRFSQVSQMMAVERNILYTDYIVVGKSTDIPSYVDINSGLIGTRFMLGLAGIFTQSGERAVPLTQVTAWGMTGEGTPTPAVSRPVVVTAFGNSLSFSWEYEDNYSAGPVSSYHVNGDGKVSGWFQDNYQYTDYYGKIYYYHFQISPTGEAITASNYEAVGNALPGTDAPESSNYILSTIDSRGPYVLRKDNREKLQVNYQINFVSCRKGLIIGSALAANVPALVGTDSSRTPKLYVLPNRVNKFASNVRDMGIDLSTLTPVSLETSGAQAIGLSATAPFPASGKAWVICTPVTSRTEQVETDTGQITTQTVTSGGDILLAQNVDVVQGEEFEEIAFMPRHHIFDQDVWMNIE